MYGFLCGMHCMQDLKVYEMLLYILVQIGVHINAMVQQLIFVYRGMLSMIYMQSMN